MSPRPAQLPPTAASQLPDATRLRELSAPLMAALEAHNSAAHAHSQAAAAYAEAAAAGLGLPPRQAASIREVARIHEIGQILIPREVLALPTSRLGDNELRMYAGRFERAGEIARSAGLGDTVATLLEAIARRPDTEPDGPRAIPVASRITAAACACDTVLVSSVGEPGSENDHIAAATSRLEALSGTALDTDVVSVLTAALRA